MKSRIESIGSGYKANKPEIPIFCNIGHKFAMYFWLINKFSTSSKLKYQNTKIQLVDLKEHSKK